MIPAKSFIWVILVWSCFSALPGISSCPHISLPAAPIISKLYPIIPLSVNLLLFLQILFIRAFANALPFVWKAAFTLLPLFFP